MNATSVPELTLELELHALACSTIYANKTDIKKQTTSWEVAWRKKCSNSLSNSKFCLVKVAPLEMIANSRLSTSAASEAGSVELTETDIPGTTLDEPLDVHNVAALRWWLQCHGIKLVHSWKSNS